MTSPAFVLTGSVLDDILAHKVQEVAVLRDDLDRLREQALEQSAPRGFASALRAEWVTLIAEVKNCLLYTSPSPRD